MSKSITTILLIENNLGAAPSIRVMLADQSLRDIQVLHAADLRQGLQHLAEHPVDSILLDLGMPDAEGLGAVSQTRSAAPHVPMVVLTGREGESAAPQILQAGANDCLIKGRVDARGLLHSLRHAAAREAMEEAGYLQKRRAQVTRNCIGDAVACTDISGTITFLNAVAEEMTGWSWQDASGRPLAEVFRIGTTGGPASDATPGHGIGSDRAVRLPPRCILVRRDGVRTSIETSVAPINDRGGQPTGSIIVFRQVSAPGEMALATTQSAQHDSITGLPNRMLLTDRVSQAIIMAARHSKKVAVLSVDLDGFKQIDESLGRQLGGKLLRSIANRLVACVRGSDTVSGQSDDKFLVLLSEVEQSDDAAITARRAQAAMAAPYAIDGHDVQVTSSIGLSVYPDDSADADTLIRNADTATQLEKATGRHSYQFFTPAMNIRAEQRQSIEQGLRRALERQEFAVHYQPKVNLRTGRITGAEALIRWTDPVRGPVAPAQFIQVAEDSGLILPIGAWVLREACKQARAWLDAGLPLTTMAVNVSAKEFRQENFLEGVLAILGETRLSPGILELELAESVLMKNAASTAILQRLKAAGVKLAIDDFGTGSSSLSDLKQFPIDILKIDESIVRQITTPPRDTAILTAAIGTGRSLKLHVVAEGVESHAEIAFLQAHQCEEGQGYYLSRPVPPGLFAKLLRTGIATAVLA
jgi:diguanylate cyclase (GGDEF)-like protein/PAS domain S-box-containing protein